MSDVKAETNSIHNHEIQSCLPPRVHSSSSSPRRVSFLFFSFPSSSFPRDLAFFGPTATSFKPASMTDLAPEVDSFGAILSLFDAALWTASSRFRFVPFDDVISGVDLISSLVVGGDGEGEEDERSMDFVVVDVDVVVAVVVADFAADVVEDVAEIVLEAFFSSVGRVNGFEVL